MRILSHLLLTPTSPRAIIPVQSVTHLDLIIKVLRSQVRSFTSVLTLYCQRCHNYGDMTFLDSPLDYDARVLYFSTGIMLPLAVSYG